MASMRDPRNLPKSTEERLLQRIRSLEEKISNIDRRGGLTPKAASTITGINQAGTESAYARADHDHEIGEEIITERTLAPEVSAMLVPTGGIVSYAGATAPDGFLLCQGQAISRTTYAALYAILGTAFGAGNGSTTFQVPDLRGRVSIGAGTGNGNFLSGSGAISTLTSLTPRTRGEWGGEEEHQLQESEIPSHNHGPGNLNFQRLRRTTLSGGGSLGAWDTGTGGTATLDGGTTGNKGGDQFHNNIQPFLVLNCIIKT